MHAISVRPRNRRPVRVTHRAAIAIRPPARASVASRPINTLWERSGWTRREQPSGTIFTGEYNVWDNQAQRFQTYRGRIEQTQLACEAYVHKPPHALLTNHPKQLCFHQIGDSSWYHMNWYLGTHDPDETLVYVTTLLEEALDG